MEKQAKAITRELVFSLLPRRAAEAHKGDFGRLLIVAGSSRYRGAARLAADGALHCGAGIVTLASTEAVIQPAACALPESASSPEQAASPRSREKASIHAHILFLIRFLLFFFES